MLQSVLDGKVNILLSRMAGAHRARRFIRNMPFMRRVTRVLAAEKNPQ